ncbi:MAG: sugar phosphate isomerase/epimerase family protein [Thermodesulfovibrionales bacterium]|nr:sugar phosphate isomerase/epimerase family protein [Thermodesulfovibrionales bacterium]
MINPHIHIPYHRIGDYLHFIKKYLLNLEIYFTSNSLDIINNSDIIRLKERLDYQPFLTFHAPFMDLSPGAVDSKVRDVTIKRFSYVFDIAETLKPEVIVFHSGYEKWKYAQRVDIWLEGSLITWRSLLPRATDLGLKIAIENIFEDEPTNLRLLMEEMGSKDFGICFDTGHCNLFSKIPLEEWLRQLKPYIIELHLHDNKRDTDTHSSIGDGTFDFDTLFSMLKDKNLIYTIEAHTPEDVLKSLERLKAYL